MNGRAGTLRFRDHLDDLRQHRVGADLVGPHHKRAVPVERAAGEALSARLLDRQRFAGDHRFVDRGAAFDHHAIHRNGLSRTNTQQIAHLHDLQRHVGFGAVRADAARRLGRQVEQRTDCRAGALARLQLQHLAEKDQRDDHGGGLEIDLDRVAVAAQFVWEEAGEQRGDHAVEIGRADAD